mmetsp:Transcript_59580/g.128953  ORF Transcript_59580/g.128953 Transcript_59580/m.128953 type:complete len:781 (+) Transcript_59580:22-2364(+)
MSIWHSFGRGEHGELGRAVVTEGVSSPGSQNADVRPLALEHGVGAEVRVRCGHFHCLALRGDGQVLAWGANGENQLGIGGELGDDAFVSSPALALVDLQERLRGDKIVDFAGGRSHSVFVSGPSGRCFVAGRRPAFELARREEAEEGLRELKLAEGNGGKDGEISGRIVACAAGEAHTLFLTSEGEVWSWLAASVSQASLGRPMARAVLGLPRVAHIACGWNHSLVLTDDGQVFAFGMGCYGQLGLGSCRSCPAPSHVILPKGCDGQVVNIAAGFAGSFAVTSRGRVYAWGANEKGQLGLGTAVKGAATPKLVNALAQVKVVQVATGFSHSACVTEGGLLYTWGNASYGQLGFAFDDSKGSVPLVAGGCAPASCSPGSCRVPEPDTGAGSSSVGHSRPWIQVWPRRCRRGPFREYRCAEVRCGAHHTLALASLEMLSLDPYQNLDVLEPQLGAGNLEDEAGMSHKAEAAGDSAALVWAKGLPERKKCAFRSVAELFWNVHPGEGTQPQPVLQPAGPVEEATAWRRAVRPQQTVRQIPGPHPLAKVSKDLRKRSFSGRWKEDTSALKLPSSWGPTTWGPVDEAVHRAFCDASVTDRTADLNLAMLVTATVGKALSPELPGGEMDRGLPPTPCRGLARIECLTPRPFYLPEDDMPDIPEDAIEGEEQPEAGAASPETPYTQSSKMQFYSDSAESLACDVLTEPVCQEAETGTTETGATEAAAGAGAEAEAVVTEAPRDEAEGDADKIPLAEEEDAEVEVTAKNPFDAEVEVTSKNPFDADRA